MCDSTLKVTARWSETWTTPAFSPMPASIRSDGGAFSPNCRRWTLLDLYEQCSLHMTEYIASSDSVGRRPRICRIRAYSSGCRPSSAVRLELAGGGKRADHRVEADLAVALGRLKDRLDRWQIARLTGRIVGRGGDPLRAPPQPRTRQSPQRTLRPARPASGARRATTGYSVVGVSSAT